MNIKEYGVDRYTALGILAILLWSMSVALARSALEQLGPITTGASVYVFSGVLCVGWLGLRRRNRKRANRLPQLYKYGCGTLFVLYTVALYVSLGLAENRHQALEVALLNYLWPTLTVLLAVPLQSKSPSLWLLPGTLMALIGISLVLNQGNTMSWSSFSSSIVGNPSAYGLGLSAAVLWAFYSNLARKWGGVNSDTGVTLFLPVTGAALLIVWLLNDEQSVWTLRATMEVGSISIVTLLGYIFWDIAVRKGDVFIVASLSYLTPFFAAVAICLYLDIAPTAGLWTGCLLIVIGSFLSWYSITE